MTDWLCFGKENAEFRLFTADPVPFEQAIAACEAQNATLARVSNQQEFDFLLEKLEDVEYDHFFLGTFAQTHTHTHSLGRI